MVHATAPQLFEISSGRSFELSSRRVWTVGDGPDADISLDDKDGSVLFQIEQDGDRWVCTPLSPDDDVLVNHSAVTGPKPLVHLTAIQAAQRMFLFLAHADARVATETAANMWIVDQLIATAGAKDVSVGETLQTSLAELEAFSSGASSIDLPGAIVLPEQQQLIGRDPGRVDICLPDVRVSRVHAWIARQGETATVTDLRSENGTYVDGQRIARPTLLRDRSRLQIGPRTFVFRRGRLYPLSRANTVELVARNLTRRVVDNKERGGRKVILDDVSLVIRPREFVCILGPSGSGKTTLLSALSGRRPADAGSVMLNGEDLYTHFDALKQNLAVVPQRDVLHDVLPLNVALWYTARMRLPADMSATDIEARIDETLDTVNLVQRQYTQIRQLSGGQIRRASWANEAISNPSLIFLDEVTSGLDEQTDAEMMRLFRRMANDGKTLVCVTHSLSNVENNCDLLVILEQGGVVAFVGPPAEALAYFGVQRLGDVYGALAAHSSEHWKQRFRESPQYDEYVARRLPQAAEPSRPGRTARTWSIHEMLAGWRQFLLLMRRYAAIQWADKRALAMMFGQSFIIALLLVWLFGDISRLDVQQEAEQLLEVTAPGVTWTDLDLLPDEQQKLLDEAEIVKRTDRSSKLLFLLLISCIWFGCNGAAKEIVKERTIFNKERDAGLKVLSYYSSKLVLLGVLAVLQASLLFWIVNGFTGLGGGAWQQWCLLSLTALVGVAMGLAISALAHTEDVAATVVPMALIPQIILAGLIAPLVHYTREFSQVAVPAYWSYQGLMKTLDDTLQERLSDGDYLNLTSALTTGDVSLVLMTYVLAFAAVALVALYLRE